MSEKEIWTNPNAGTVYIKTYDLKGNLVGTAVGSGRKIAISTEERQINQELAASQEQDPFLDGRLRPVKLIDSAEDYEEIASNPNVMSESDILALFKLSVAQLKKKLQEITNVTIVSFMEEVAVNGSVDAKVSQVNAIKARLGELSSAPASNPDVREGLNSKIINA